MNKPIQCKQCGFAHSKADRVWVVMNEDYRYSICPTCASGKFPHPAPIKPLAVIIGKPTLLQRLKWRLKQRLTGV